MTYPITYHIEDGNIEVTADREGTIYSFNLKFADGRSSSFGYTEDAPNKIALSKPVTDRSQYQAMLALWQMEIS